jgi:hypothetical protein
LLDPVVEAAFGVPITHARPAPDMWTLHHVGF